MGVDDIPKLSCDVLLLGDDVAEVELGLSPFAEEEGSMQSEGEETCRDFDGEIERCCDGQSGDEGPGDVVSLEQGGVDEALVDDGKIGVAERGVRRTGRGEVGGEERLEDREICDLLDPTEELLD